MWALKVYRSTPSTNLYLLVQPINPYLAQTPKGRLVYRAYINQYMGPVPCTFTLVYSRMSRQSLNFQSNVCERHVPHPTNHGVALPSSWSGDLRVFFAGAVKKMLFKCIYSNYIYIYLYIYILIIYTTFLCKFPAPMSSFFFWGILFSYLYVQTAKEVDAQPSKSMIRASSFSDMGRPRGEEMRWEKTYFFVGVGVVLFWVGWIFFCVFVWTFFLFDLGCWVFECFFLGGAVKWCTGLEIFP